MAQLEALLRLPPVNQNNKQVVGPNIKQNIGTNSLKMKQQSEIARRGGFIEESDINSFTQLEKKISNVEKCIDTAERCLEELEEIAFRAESVASSLDFFISQQTPRPIIEKYLNSVGWS